MAKKRSFSEARGLDNLFSENERSANDAGVVRLRLSDVEPKADQPRKDFDEELLLSLSESISKTELSSPFWCAPPLAVCIR